MVALNPQAWAVLQIAIANPPNATVQETNQYQQELVNLHLGLTNVAAFVGIQNVVHLPVMPIPALGANSAQAIIDSLLVFAALRSVRASCAQFFMCWYIIQTPMALSDSAVSPETLSCKLPISCCITL